MQPVNTKHIKEEKKIPTLRFHGFDGEWEVSKLSEKIKFLAGYAFKSEEMLKEPSIFQLIKMSNVYKNELRLDRSPSYWKNLNTNQDRFLLRKGDVVLTLTGTVNKRDYGYSVIIPEDDKFLLNQRLVSLRKEESKSENGFIRQLVLTDHFYYYFFSNSKGGTGNQSNVSIEDLKNITLNLPSIPEQQKIASFLFAVDQKIQQLTRKKELLELFKKGVMQKIFSQEIRFHDENGKDYSDWEEKRLGDVSYITTGSSNRVDSILDGEYSFFDRSEEIRTSNIYLFDAEAIIVPGEGQGFIPKYFNGKFDLHQRTYAIMNFSNCSGKYLFYSIHYFRQYFLSQAVGSTVKSLRLPMFKKMKIALPSVAEQQKIASFLSTIDDKITEIDAQLEKSQTFKKGLLQQMFV